MATELLSKAPTKERVEHIVSIACRVVSALQPLGTVSRSTCCQTEFGRATQIGSLKDRHIFFVHSASRRSP